MIYLTLFLEFFKIGLFCFGGAFGMIPLIEETVVSHGWLTEARFYELVGVCESTPGPIAVNMATYIGSMQGGALGSIVATSGVVMPSFLIILLIASVLNNLAEHRYFKGFMKGVQPVVVALILSTGLILLAKTLGFAGGGVLSPDFASIIIFGLLAGVYFLLAKVFGHKMTAVEIILLSAALGIGVGVLGELSAGSK